MFRLSAERPRTCPECGAAFAPAVSHAAFCCVACKNTWGNRRLQRGALFYDLYMHFRFARADARRLNVFAALNRLAHIFRQEDLSEREGRLSWRSPAIVFEERPYIIVKRGRA